ncbi:MAG: IS3 family transposase [Candidatus Eremiobacteraeota bacterium]|nr:IS3 family transposase [Candidatus Eremiobacteraeota bacterium]
MAKPAQQRGYPPEYRRKILELVRAGRSVASLSREFEVARPTIMGWMKQDDADSGRREDILTSDEREELIKLRRENKRLKLEQEILFKSRGLVRSRGSHDSREIFGFVRAYQAEYSIKMICRVLEVSESGYYAWCGRAPSSRAQANQLLGDRVEAIYRRSRSTYGRPRIQAELRDEGIRAGDKRIARLMRERNCRGASRRKYLVTTVRDHTKIPAPDLVDRKFVARGPNQLWVADITYVPTWSGFLYLAIVLDVFSRRVVGWSMANHMRKELVVAALDMAIFRRKPTRVVHHSDQGSQYTSIAFGARCQEAGIRASMGSVGDCYDNAMCESFNATLECELLAKHRFKTQREASLAVFDFIEGWYNPHRRHSALGYLSPNNYERRKIEAA